MILIKNQGRHLTEQLVFGFQPARLHIQFAGLCNPLVLQKYSSCSQIWFQPFDRSRPSDRGNWWSATQYNEALVWVRNVGNFKKFFGSILNSAQALILHPLPRICHSVRPSSPSVLVRNRNYGPPPFLMPCCIGCSEINKINRHLICSPLPHLWKKDLPRKRL